MNERGLLYPSRRRFLMGASAASALPLLVPRRSAAQLFTAGSSAVAGFPGQAGNLVGYNHEPSYPGSLSAGGTITGGSGGSPLTYSYLDYDGGTSGTIIPSHTRFVGCRFQCNAQGFYNVICNNTGDIEFHYCSFVPRVALVGNTPPGYTVWPTAGSGNTSKVQVDGTNCTPGAQGYQYGTHIQGTSQPGPILHDHCDFWGFGNATDIVEASTIQITYQDCWFHDSANAQPNGYHTDGPGYLNGGAPPANVKVDHCTIASLGNTNGLAFQTATSPYVNLIITNNYLAGFGYHADPGHGTVGSSVSFTGNVFGTDVPWLFGPIYSAPPGTFNSSTWHNNKFKVSQITAPIVDGQTTFLGWTAADDGKFMLPDSTLSTVDF